VFKTLFLGHGWHGCRQNLKKFPASMNVTIFNNNQILQLSISKSQTNRNSWIVPVDLQRKGIAVISYNINYDDIQHTYNLEFLHLIFYDSGKKKVKVNVVKHDNINVEEGTQSHPHTCTLWSLHLRLTWGSVDLDATMRRILKWWKFNTEITGLG
jgi:hypothetical protein